METPVGEVVTKLGTGIWWVSGDICVVMTKLS